MKSRSVVVVAWMGLTFAASGCGSDSAVVADGSTSEGAATTSGEPDDTTGAPPSTTTTAEASGTTTTDPGTEEVGSEAPGFLWDVGQGLHIDLGVSETTGPIIDWDCDELVQPYESETELIAPRGYHDVWFDEDGHILGWDGNSILSVTYDDMVSVFLPGVSSGVQGMDGLENGDLLFVNFNSELRRVTPELQQTTVATGLNGAYGMTVGPDQMAYVCTSSEVVRVDPETGDQASWLILPGNQTPRAIVFNLDSTGAYMSTLLEPGSPVYFVEVDENLDPTGDAVTYATGVGQGYHDGLGIDACGNLYVPDYSTRGLYRVDTEGVVTTLYTQASAGANHYGHGLDWGSGIDGWNHKAMYLPQPYDGNTVLEVVLGVPSGSYVRTWRGS